jgi:hypothetical protein
MLKRLPRFGSSKKPLTGALRIPPKITMAKTALVNRCIRLNGDGKDFLITILLEKSFDLEKWEFF